MKDSNNDFSNFCLGTAQFGMNYGLDNLKDTKIKNKEIEDIFNFFFINKGMYIDTAQNYGDSEKIISKYLSKDSKVITKFKFDDGMSIEEVATKSLMNLNIPLLDTVLIHNSEALVGGRSALDQLIKLKDQKFTKNIGISIYSLKDIWGSSIDFGKEILSCIDVLQIQGNAFDKSFFDEENLKDINKDIRIDMRSIFLQGVLLQDISILNSMFPKFYKELNLWETYCKQNSLPKLNAALLNLPNHNRLNSLTLFGCRSLKEIQEIKYTIESIDELDSLKFSSDFPKELIDPRLWK